MTAVTYVWLYSVSAAHVCACAQADMDAAAVAAAVDGQAPPGPGLCWITEGGKFTDGSASPVPCNTEPDGRRHWLLRKI